MKGLARQTSKKCAFIGIICFVLSTFQSRPPNLSSIGIMQQESINV